MQTKERRRPLRSATWLFAVAALDVLVAAAVIVTPAEASKCASDKLKATGTRTAADLICYSKAVAKGDPVDAACLGKAGQKFDDAFGKAEETGDCTITGDAAAIDALLRRPPQVQARASA